jgi:hypothetical protein
VGQCRTKNTATQPIDPGCQETFTFFYSLTCFVTDWGQFCQKLNDMKKMLVPIMFLTTSLFGQSLNYEQSQDVNITTNYSNGDTLSSYVMKDGSEIKIGSKLKFGTPINENKNFMRLYFGEFSLGKSLLISPVQLGDVYTGEEVIVTSIKVQHSKLTKKSPLQIMLYVQNPSAPALARNRTIFDLEMAIDTKEVVNPNAAMTKEQAIAKLKEAKDLVDLGMMTQLEFDQLKEKLTPIIMKKD